MPIEINEFEIQGEIRDTTAERPVIKPLIDDTKQIRKILDEIIKKIEAQLTMHDYEGF